MERQAAEYLWRGRYRQDSERIYTAGYLLARRVWGAWGRWRPVWAGGQISLTGLMRVPNLAALRFACWEIDAPGEKEPDTGKA